MKLNPRSVLILILSTLSISFVIVSLVILMNNHLTLPGSMASIEQLRKDVNKVDSIQSHEVMAQVTSWNQFIASNKQYRTLWWGKIYVPSKWDSIQEIEIPNSD